MTPAVRAPGGTIPPMHVSQLVSQSYSTCHNPRPFWIPIRRCVSTQRCAHICRISVRAHTEYSLYKVHLPVALPAAHRCQQRSASLTPLDTIPNHSGSPQRHHMYLFTYLHAFKACAFRCTRFRRILCHVVLIVWSAALTRPHTATDNYLFFAPGSMTSRTTKSKPAVQSG